jgi:hypothetical protein
MALGISLTRSRHRIIALWPEMATVPTAHARPDSGPERQLSGPRRARLPAVQTGKIRTFLDAVGHEPFYRRGQRGGEMQTETEQSALDRSLAAAALAGLGPSWCPRNTDLAAMHGLIHDWVGLSAFVVMALTPLVFAGSLRRVPGWVSWPGRASSSVWARRRPFLTMPLGVREAYFGIGLTARGYRVKGVATVDLSWSRPTATSFDVFGGGAKITTTTASAYTDTIDKSRPGRYTYQVCQATLAMCSDQVTVTSRPGPPRRSPRTPQDEVIRSNHVRSLGSDAGRRR